MSSGLNEIMTKWEKGTETERGFAKELKMLLDGHSPPTAFLPVFERLQGSEILSRDAVFCLLADLVEEAADKAAEEAIGTWEDAEDQLRDLRGELIEELTVVINSFAKRHLLPRGEVLECIHDLLHEPEWKDTAPDYYERKKAKVAGLLPDLFSHFGLSEMGTLLRCNAVEFKKRKEAGERCLLGRTYQEDSEAFNSMFFGERPPQK